MKNVLRTVMFLICFSVSALAQSGGNALQFDGNNDYVDLGNSTVFNIGSAVTYEAWIFPETTLTSWIFNKWQNFVDDKQLILSGGHVFFYLHNVFGGSQLMSASTAPLNQFTHIAVTYDGTTAKIYINGVFDTSKSVGSGVSNGTGNLFIGEDGPRNDVNVNTFRGIIDEFRIWNVARTEAEIQSTMNQPLVGNETGLVGYWSFDEGSGSTTADITSNGNDGLVSGAAWVVSGVALPVELTSFTAEVKTQGVELVWKTATEKNNYGFEIERKPLPIPPLTGEETKGWGRVGFVEGSGTTNSSKKYSYSDKNLSSGKYRYRLKQIDRDGKFEYSQAVEATITNIPKEFALTQNYPNPFNPSTVISYQLPMTNHITLKVYDAIGREVATLVNEVKEAGIYSTTFDASKLSSGIYFARLLQSSNSRMMKMNLIK